MNITTLAQLAKAATRYIKAVYDYERAKIPLGDVERGSEAHRVLEELTWAQSDFNRLAPATIILALLARLAVGVMGWTRLPDSYDGIVATRLYRAADHVCDLESAMLGGTP